MRKLQVSTLKMAKWSNIPSMELYLTTHYKFWHQRQQFIKYNLKIISVPLRLLSIHLHTSSLLSTKQTKSYGAHLTQKLHSIYLWNLWNKCPLFWLLIKNLQELLWMGRRVYSSILLTLLKSYLHLWSKALLLWLLKVQQGWSWTHAYREFKHA